MTMSASGDCEKRVVVNDLSTPVQVSVRDRGLQITIALVDAVKNNLHSSAAEALQNLGERHLQAILVEARKLASEESDDLEFQINKEHIAKAELAERKRLRPKRDWWDTVRNISFSGIGSAVGFIQKPYIALTLFVVFGAFLYISKDHA
jgi:hypothetical protein